jgi:protein TonB
MSRRTVLVVVSILAHLAIGVGLFASGIWKLERLESDHRIAAIGVMTPSQAAGGSPADLPEPKLRKKQVEVEKKIVKNVQWDRRVEKTDVKAVATTAGGTGNGDGEGKGDRDGDGDSITDELCAVPPCTGTGTGVPPPPKPPVQKTHTVTPTVMSALRISGQTQIQPPEHVREHIRDNRKARVVGSVKLCIDARGAITSATMLGTTGYRDYDERLVGAVRGWRYRPFLVNGTPAPACSVVSFVYSIK